MRLPEVIEAIRPAMNAGYLVVVWTPEELAGVSPEDIEKIESRVIEVGNIIIQTYNGPQL